ncbi:recombinase family protein, partial [Streptomyces sp. NPDC058171]
MILTAANAPRSAVACTEPAKRTAIIYARVSKDMSGIQRSPTEQVAECRAICERNGWLIREVIVDNDLSASAFARKQRPGYRRVMTEIQPGEVLVVWEPSRITRRMDDHLDLVNLCQASGILFCAGGEIIDFTDPSAELNAGVKAQFAQYESAQTARRVQRATRARAESGRPHGNLGFGYRRIVAANDTTVGWETDAEAARIVARVAERLLAGDSLYKVSADLNAEGSRAPGRTPSEAGPWTPVKVKAMVLRPALAGLRVFRGEVIGDSTWPAIITPDQHERLKAVLTHRSQRTPSGPKTSHLSSGIAECSECGGGMYWRARGGRKTSPPQYRCQKGCTQRNAEIVDGLV